MLDILSGPLEKHSRQPKVQSRMDNPDTPVILDTRQRQTKQKTQHRKLKGRAKLTPLKTL